MHIVLNGAPKTVPDHTPVDRVVQETVGPQTDGVAVAINGDVVRRAVWAETPLREGDTVEILHAVAGG